MHIKNSNSSCLRTLKYDVDLGNDFYNFLELVTHANTIPMCDNPDEYFYWDASHFSAQIHRTIGYMLDDAVAKFEANECWTIDSGRILELSATTSIVVTMMQKFPILRLAFRTFML
ncbi:hypothetical protein FBU59_005322 [Linderina macrospora]|uniref:Uncharacterized protein n=1 Tax=Linderina macrospora TaxID=4868 RepID=A0ACC1J3B3_9FUNG|nr:hypothetical protein FBU59_005322 [Linderina macrospora]